MTEPTPPADTQHSPTAIPTPDTLMLGRTPGQRGAEILAGLRAELLPSPETNALAKFSGRLTARLVMTMEKSQAALNYVAVRPASLTALAHPFIADKSAPVIVDIACGFSPRGMLLAREYPDATIIEIDLPDVVHDKRNRLRQARKLEVPQNIHWIGADLGKCALSEVLQGTRADVVIAEGLTAYFTPEDNTTIARHARDSLKEGGAFIADYPQREGMAHAQKATRFFSRQAGEYLGIMDSPEQLKQVLADAGYSAVDITTPTECARRFRLPLPVLDFSYFVVATY